jgi:O-antigen/teichoic acid export membrane protein
MTKNEERASNRSLMKHLTFGPLVRNAMALLLSGGGSGLVGIVFWALAAHEASARVIGRTSAELATITLLAYAAQGSFGSTFVRFLPIAGERTRSFILRAYLFSTSIAFVISVLYVALGLGHRFIPTPWSWRVLFVASVVAWTIFALQDSALTGLRATHWVPVENISYGVVKLALIPAFLAISATQGIFLAWMAPVVVVIALVNIYLFRRRIPEHMGRPSPPEALPSMRQLISMTGAQYAQLLVGLSSNTVVTLIVIDRLGAVANAHYYLPAQIALGALVAVWSIDRSFLVEASAEPAELYRHAQVAMRAALLVVVPTVVIGVIFAPWILQIFGHAYATSGTTLMRLLMLSLPGTAVTAFYSSFAWIDRRVWKLAVRDLVSAIVFFALIIIFIGHFGIVSVGIASVIQAALQLLFFVPPVARRYRLSARAFRERDGSGAAPVIDN